MGGDGEEMERRLVKLVSSSVLVVCSEARGGGVGSSRGGKG